MHIQVGLELTELKFEIKLNSVLTVDVASLLQAAVASSASCAVAAASLILTHTYARMPL